MDIVNLLLNILILCGVAVILYSRPEAVKTTQKAVRKVKNKFKPEKLGGIENLSAEEENKRGTRLEETELAMEDILTDMFGGKEEVKEYYEKSIR
jgi:hypothetical protein